MPDRPPGEHPRKVIHDCDYALDLLAHAGEHYDEYAANLVLDKRLEAMRELSDADLSTETSNHA